MNTKYRTKVIDGYEVNFGSDWVNDLEREIHFKWYYHQAEMVYNNCSREQKIVEIGPGTGLLSDMLKKRGWDIQTLDIDEDKNPDHVDSAVDFDYRANNVNVVLAFEIFEHIPFPTFEKVIKKIAESKVESVQFSLPWNERQLVAFSLKLPNVPPFEWSWSVPRGRIQTKAHFWELAKKPKKLGEKRLVPVNTMQKIFEDNGYVVARENKVGYIQYFTASRH